MRHAVLHGVGLSTESAAHNSAVSPAIPALAFNAADQAALTAFGATHRNFILDGRSWRGNLNIDEQRFSQNEAFQLAAAGGGVVLGADDASGALILQHVDQVAGWFNLNRFTGIYNTAPAKHVFGGLFLNSPNSVDPTNVVGTTSYAEVPHGLQPNRVVLATAVFGFDSEPQPIFSVTGPGQRDVRRFQAAALRAVSRRRGAQTANGSANPIASQPGERGASRCRLGARSPARRFTYLRVEDTPAGAGVFGGG